jgi:hypothetical protein
VLILVLVIFEIGGAGKRDLAFAIKLERSIIYAKRIVGHPAPWSTLYVQRDQGP